MPDAHDIARADCLRLLRELEDLKRRVAELQARLRRVIAEEKDDVA
jgi:hypothetical protein